MGAYLFVGNMKTEHFNSTKPSVVMVVMGYNRQDSIGYAIDSALLQDYDGPMTIVLSDDCSSDGTFDVMRQKAKTYLEAPSCY